MPKRKCKSCQNYVEEFIKLPAGVFCNIDHAISFANDKQQKAREKARKADTKIRKEKLKTVGQWLKEAQTAFNAYIRERDKKDACISCGRKSGAKENAGHYKSVGAFPELRFCEENCHLQCEHCNSWKSGNIAEYRPNLVNKISLARVEWIEGPHAPARYRIEDAKRIKEEYKNKLKALRNGSTIGLQ